jgi:glutathione synthase/RimK-type ligase-like ATP-grasp enzyme
LAVNKRLAFERLAREDVSTVQFSADRADGIRWQEGGSLVVCRHRLTGSGGEGISVCGTDEELPDVPLYTRYFRAEDEYRLHVYRGRVFDIQLKRRRLDSGATNEIRNSANGWVFTREGVTAPAIAHAESIAAVATLGLDFGAVDLKVSRNGNVGILEVNTAPGLEGTTLDKYGRALGAAIREG